MTPIPKITEIEKGGEILVKMRFLGQERRKRDQDI